ncbi:MAG: cbb3-type cytochrome c oxidase subunit I [Lentisphaerae bacterium]|nr:cbb3-type cytochrome c oxidase subunit I [Lentisphaerota bacterium]
MNQKPLSPPFNAMQTQPPPCPASPDYLHAGYTLRSWLLTRDHKRLALLYLLSVTLFFVAGHLAGNLMRVELLAPAGLFLTADTYHKLFSLHGMLMLFFFALPAIPCVLGNFLVPPMLGVRDMAFPRLNLAAWYSFTLGGTLVLLAGLLGGVDSTWTFLPPYGSEGTGTNVTVAAIGIMLGCLAIVLTGVNFMGTFLMRRTAGEAGPRVPLLVWCHGAASLVMILAPPVLMIALGLLVMDRAGGLSVFTVGRGGDPVLFQHLFWFGVTPIIYLIILTAIGVVSEIVSCFARRPVHGQPVVVACCFIIAVASFLIWGQHLYLSGQSAYTSLVFSFLSMLIAVPLGLVGTHWIATLYRGSIRLDSPMLYALAFILLFVVGTLSGLMLALLPSGAYLHNTYFVVAHLHYLMVGGALMAFLGGLHFWWPKITGRLYPERLARNVAVLIFAGINATFLPLMIMGLKGLPRRHHVYPPEFQVWQVMSTAGASLLGIGLLVTMLYMFWSLRRGPRAGANPWTAATPEWNLPSPPAATGSYSLRGAS